MSFVSEVLKLPGTIVSGLFDRVLGSNNHAGRKESPGLLGLTLETIRIMGRAISDFIANHQKEIIFAFWSSLALGCLTVLIVGPWPAALNAITTYTINGYSIAGLVGVDFTAQLAATAGFIGLATSLFIYAVAFTYNTTNNIIGSFANKSLATPDSNGPDGPNGNSDDVDHHFNGSAQSLAALREFPQAAGNHSDGQPPTATFTSIAIAPPPPLASRRTNSADSDLAVIPLTPPQPPAEPNSLTAHPLGK